MVGTWLFTFRMRDKTSKLAYIDSLRAIAILLVVLFHTGIDYQPIRTSFIWPIIHNGMYGVQLFYVVSAFTLFLSYHRRIGEGLSIDRNFFIRRFFRIAPLYYLAVIYYLWQNGFGPRGRWMSGESSITSANILSNIFFLHGTNPNWINTVVPGGWSIASEMAFYVLVPLLVRLIRNTSQALIFVLISLVCLSLLHHLLAPWRPIPSVWLWEQYLYLYLPSQLPVFGLGILMYFLIYPGSDFSAKTSPRLYMIASFLWLCTLLQSKSGILPPHVLFGTCFMVVSVALSQYPIRLLVNPALGYIGRISYSMYLTHFAVIHFHDRYIGKQIVDIESRLPGIASFGLRFLLIVTATAIVSSIFYRIIELPGQALGQALIKRITTKTSPVLALGSKP